MAWCSQQEGRADLSVVRFAFSTRAGITGASDRGTSDEEDRYSSWRAAIQDLQGFPGRRILLFDGAPRQADKPLVAEVQSRLGQVYFVDGGIPKTETYQLDPYDRQGYAISSPLSVTSEVTKRVSSYDQVIVHEPAFSSATRDAYTDAGNYYNVSFHLGGATAPPITLTIRGLTGAFFDAPIYGVEAVALSSQRRTNAAQRLIVQGKK